MKKIAISGVGRSGTTSLFAALENTFLAHATNPSFYYEPFLWNLRGFVSETGHGKQPFRSTSSLSPKGIYHHTRIPLFTPHNNPADPFLAELYDAEKNYPSDIRLVKFIKLSGRLQALLNTVPDVKIIQIIRNPFDTVNSCLSLFSFFGDEHHPTDKWRFVSEVSDKFSIDLNDLFAKEEVDWSFAWWKFMTDASLRAAAKFPEKIFLLSHEALRADPTRSYDAIWEFLELPFEWRAPGAGRTIFGPVTDSVKLSPDEAWRYRGLHEEYFQALEKADASGVDLKPEQVSARVSAKYLDGARYDPSARKQFAPLDASPLIVREHLRKSDHVETHGLDEAEFYLSELAWRKQTEKLVRSLKTSRFLKYSGALSKRVYRSISAIEQSLKRPANRDVTCIVTSFNNGPALKRAVLSVLTQTTPPGKIIVADDCSTIHDDAYFADIAALSGTIEIHRRRDNVGVAMNRHLAIVEAKTAFITHIDGDDVWGPKKLESEFRTLGGSHDNVAFSDYVVEDDKGGRERLNFSGLPGEDIEARVKYFALRSGPIPRDMLFSKSLYASVGGYRPNVDMYEDWSLKIRLASRARKWLGSGVHGCHYKRNSAGLSAQHKLLHVFWRLNCYADCFDVLSNRFGENDWLRAMAIAAAPGGSLAPVVQFTHAVKVALGDRAFDEKLYNMFEGITTRQKRRMSSLEATNALSAARLALLGREAEIA